MGSIGEEQTTGVQNVNTLYMINWLDTNWKTIAAISGGITLLVWIIVAYSTMASLDRCEYKLYQAEKKINGLERERDSLLLCQQYEMYYEE